MGCLWAGWINAIIPVLIVPYYSVIGGWVIKYLVEYVKGGSQTLAEDGYFSAFIADGFFYRNLFPVLCTAYAGDHLCRCAEWRGTSFQINDADTGIFVYSHCRLFGNKTRSTGRREIFSDTKYQKLLLDDSGCGNGTDVYSLSIAMGILVTFGSYMKKDVSIEGSTQNVEIFDTAIAMMAGLMIIPAVFAFSGGEPDTLQAGPALMFITIPKVFASMGFGTLVGILFFVLVLCAALTSSIALTESAVSTFQDD